MFRRAINPACIHFRMRYPRLNLIPLSIMIDQICEAFLESTANGASAEARIVKPYEAPTDAGTHQFVLFIKPEATAVDEGVDLAAILKTVTSCLDTFDVEVGAVSVLNGPTLKAQQIMDRHYGVINAISKGGVDAISASAKEKLQADFGDDIAAGTPVLGGHQFIEANPDFSALALSTINDNIGTSKLAGGTYILQLDLFGKKQLILNPFHPYQLVPFTSEGKAIVVMECRSKTAWADLRGKLTGTTNPATAEEGSIRQQFLANQDALGLPAVNQGSNGIHLSAGPLEGMVELQRFFADHSTGTALAADQTAFGQLMAAKGISADRITELCGNCDLDVNGDQVSAFDLTEEIDADESATRLLG